MCKCVCRICGKLVKCRSAFRQHVNQSIGSPVDGGSARSVGKHRLANSGSGYNSPTSQGGSNSRAITRTAVLPVEEYTGQIYTRVRGRQLAIKVESDGEGVTWQLGAPRIDMRPDGRR